MPMSLIRCRAMSEPQHDAAFRAFLAESLHYAKTAQLEVPFRAWLQHFAKTQGLTRTYAVLECKLYKSPP